MVGEARLLRKTVPSPNGVHSGLKRKREEEESEQSTRRPQQWKEEDEGEQQRTNVPVVRRNTIAMGDMYRERVTVKGSVPQPPARTTSLKLVSGQQEQQGWQEEQAWQDQDLVKQELRASRDSGCSVRSSGNASPELQDSRPDSAPSVKSEQGTTSPNQDALAVSCSLAPNLSSILTARCLVWYTS